MEKIIFFSLVIPILGFVLYLGATAIMKGFSAKSANKVNDSTEDEKIDELLNDGNKLSDEIEKLNQLLMINYLSYNTFLRYQQPSSQLQCGFRCQSPLY